MAASSVAGRRGCSCSPSFQGSFFVLIWRDPISEHFPNMSEHLITRSHHCPLWILLFSFFFLSPRVRLHTLQKSLYGDVRNALAAVRSRSEFPTRRPYLTSRRRRSRCAAPRRRPTNEATCRRVESSSFRGKSCRQRYLSYIVCRLNRDVHIQIQNTVTDTKYIYIIDIAQCWQPSAWHAHCPTSVFSCLLTPAYAC